MVKELRLNEKQIKKNSKLIRKVLSTRLNEKGVSLLLQEKAYP
jgi:hypothetical protein